MSPANLKFLLYSAVKLIAFELIIPSDHCVLSHLWTLDMIRILFNVVDGQLKSQIDNQMADIAQ